MPKVSLSWIPQIFENYKKQLYKEYWDNHSLPMEEFHYKNEAADELLKNIKNFIEESNQLVNKPKNIGQLKAEKALETIAHTQELNRKICEIGACIHSEHQKKD